MIEYRVRFATKGQPKVGFIDFGPCHCFGHIGVGSWDWDEYPIKKIIFPLRVNVAAKAEERWMGFFSRLVGLENMHIRRIIRKKEVWLVVTMKPFKHWKRTLLSLIFMRYLQDYPQFIERWFKRTTNEMHDGELLDVFRTIHYEKGARMAGTDGLEIPYWTSHCLVSFRNNYDECSLDYHKQTLTQFRENLAVGCSSVHAYFYVKNKT